MTNIDELQEKELNEINENSEFDLNELEDLILSGTEARIPILIEYPYFNKKTGTVETAKYTAKLRPLTTTEVNNARRSTSKIKGTSFEVELLKRALYTKEDKLFKPTVISAMKAGVINNLVETLLDISGIKVDKEEQEAYARELMGF